ncbi:mCG145221, partial [Mus musculus]
LKQTMESSHWLAHHGLPSRYVLPPVERQNTSLPSFVLCPCIYRHQNTGCGVGRALGPLGQILTLPLKDPGKQVFVCVKDWGSSHHCSPMCI